MSRARDVRRISHALLAVCILGVVAPPLVPAAQAVAEPTGAPVASGTAAATVRALSNEKYTALDGAAYDQYGCAVATSGDIAVVGARLGDKDGTPAGEDTGSAYAYMRHGASWESIGKAKAPDGAFEDMFGESVAVYGNTIAVGAPQDDTLVGIDAGSVYVFTWTGSYWSFPIRIEAPPAYAAADERFGVSVALYQDTLLVGAQNVNAPTVGGGYVFTRTGSTWTFQAKLIDPSVVAGDYFGFDVALHRDTAVIGAAGDDDKGTDAGAAYVFVRSGGMWPKQGKLTATDGAADDYMGAAVALDRDTVLAGATGTGTAGAAYVFRRSGTSWTQAQKLTPAVAAAGDGFGVDVTIWGDTAVVGAPGAYAERGKVCFFGRSTGPWTQYGEMSDSLGHADDQFGYSVSAGGGRFVIGVPKDDEVADDAGAMHVFVTEGLPFTGVRRVAGANRYATAVQSSKIGHMLGAPTVVIATGENWPDALGGSSLAGAVRGPILLTRKTALPSEVRAEILRLGARKAYILGSTASVSAAVEAELVTLLGRPDVVRLGGADRYETDHLIIKETIKLLGPAWDGICIVATGANYPDALAVSPFAAFKGVPIILVNPRSTAAVAPSGTEEVGIVGSTAAVSQAVEDAYRGLLGTTRVSRIGGANRYATAALVAQRCVDSGDMQWDAVGLATGQNFPDALAAGPMLALSQSVLVLTRPTALPGETKTALITHAAEIDHMNIFGDTNAVSAAVEAEAKAAAGITP